MNGFGCVAPAYAWGWLLLPVLAAWLEWRSRRRAAAVAAVCGPRVDHLLGRPYRPRLRTGLGAVAVLGVTLAFLQPVAGELPGEPLGADVMLCVDVSRSMRARDQAPDRLGAAGAAIADAVDAAFGARFGLLAFAGAPRLLVPLSQDLGAVATLAADLDPGLCPPGSDLGAAIERATEALVRAGHRGGSIVVLTDGEDFAGKAQAAASAAAAAGIAVFCLGFGTSAGSKIVVDTEAGQRFLQDAQGRDVITALDPASLAAVAAAGGGRFALAAALPLATLYRDHLQPRALAAARDDHQREQAHRFQWPLLAALLAWMLRRGLPERRR